MLYKLCVILPFLLGVLAVYVPSNECFACLNPIPTANFTHFFQCEHSNIHQQCIDNWIDIKGILATCPLCRASPVIPIEATVQNCRSTPMHFSRAIRLAYRLIDSDRWSELVSLFQMCEFPIESHYTFIEYAAQGNRWDIASLHLSWMSEELDFNHLENTFKYAIEADEGIAMTLMLTLCARMTRVHIHRKCIREFKWVCSNAIIDYYRIRSISVNIGDTVINAVRSKMPRALFINLLDLLSVNASISSIDLFNALLLTSHDETYLLFPALLDVVVVRENTIPESFQAEIILHLLRGNAMVILKSILDTNLFTHEIIASSLQTDTSTANRAVVENYLGNLTNTI